MDTLSAYARGLAAENNELMVFDWDEAARLIRDRKPQTARAGLASDWEWTGGDIYHDGKPVDAGDTYTFLASTWATPELDMDDDVRPCFKMASAVPDWNSATYWPESARAILNGGVA